MRAGPARIQSKLRVGGACLLAALIAAPAAMAQEPLPNQSCAGVATGVFRQSGGPEISGGHMLVCDGTNWRSVMSYDASARLTKLGNQTCGEGDILQFSSAIWQCEDSEDLGSSLWELSDGVLEPTTIAKLQWGNGNTASGVYSTAFGTGSTASGYSSLAVNGTATGPNSMAVGFYPTASGYGSTAFGAISNAGGAGSMAWGGQPESANFGGTASGTASTAFGIKSVASGTGSTAWGNNSTASGTGGTAWGSFTHAGSYLETSLGRYPLNTAGTAGSWVATDTLFEIGNGASSAARANALTLLKNGKLGLGDASPDGDLLLDVEGQVGATAYCDAGGDNCFSATEVGLWEPTGQVVRLTSAAGLQWGGINGATGLYSTVWGAWNDASGANSTAWGGSGVAGGSYSTAWGLGAHSGSYLETSVGRYPMSTAGTAGSWVATDVLFEIGNGSHNSLRSNAVTVLKNGNVGIGTAEPQSALHIPDGKYLQIEDNNAGPPPNADCDSDAERGRMSLDTANSRLYVCMGAADGWDYTSLSDGPPPPQGI